MWNCSKRSEAPVKGGCGRVEVHFEIDNSVAAAIVALLRPTRSRERRGRERRCLPWARDCKTQPSMSLRCSAKAMSAYSTRPWSIHRTFFSALRPGFRPGAQAEEVCRMGSPAPMQAYGIERSRKPIKTAGGWSGE